jgi:hypothetical protein
VLDANRAGLLIEHLTAVTRWFPQLVPETLPGITRATTELLGACLAMEAGRADFGLRESPVLMRARAYVEHNLLEPSLNPAKISEAHFSRSFRKAFNIRPSDLRSLQPALGDEPDTPFSRWTDTARGA